MNKVFMCSRPRFHWTMSGFGALSRELAGGGHLLLAPGRDALERIGTTDWLLPALASSEPLVLTGEAIEALWKAHSSTDSIRPAPGRVIAPILPSTNDHTTPSLGDYRIEMFPDIASDIDTDLTVHYDITGRSRTEGKIDDITSLFRNRIEKLRKEILKTTPLSRPITVLQLIDQRAKYTGYDTSATIVGLVSNPRFTKAGNLLFTIEDETASVECLITRSEEDVNDIVHVGLMPDDVIGLKGSFSRNNDLFFAEQPYFPRLEVHERAHAEQGVSVAFISDLHVGSKTFLDDQWVKMRQWFHTDPLARTIKYLILSGDVVDGIGIYPGQENELSIPDLFNQYGHLAGLLDDFPDWVEILLLPGNHDAVRPQEPQPALEPDIQNDFNSTTFVGNPCDFSLHGVRLLSYHGKSIDDFVGTLRNVDYGCPVEAMREMMRRRHLAPTWGSKTPLSPEPEDDLIIGARPDIFVTGHVHGHHCEDHKGTTLVCSSTWQNQTAYQRMLGFQPKPCILTVINLQTHAAASIPFA